MPSPPKARPIKQAKDGQPSSSASASRRKYSSGRISAACEACKRRKTKCTGGPPPCQLCESLGTECVIDLSLDMRRRAALQRTIDESRSYQDALSGLVGSIIDGGLQNFGTVVEFLRTNPSPQDIAQAMQQSRGSTRSQKGGLIDNDLDAQLSSPAEDGFDPFQLLQQEESLTGVVDPRILRVNTKLGMTQPGRGRGKEVQTHVEISVLLQRLRQTSDLDAEALLRRFLAAGEMETVLQDGELSSWPQSSAVSSISENQAQNSRHSGQEERAHWHPALQVRPSSVTSDSLPSSRGVQSGSFDQYESRGHTQRRYSDASSASAPSFPTFSNPPNSSQAVPQYSSAYPRGYEQSAFPTEDDLFVAQEDRRPPLRIPIHLVQPLIIPDESYLSRLYSDYVQGARQMIFNGVSLSEIVGDSQEIVVDLFFRKRQPSDKFDCSSWACEMNRSFTEIDQYVRLAQVLLQTYMMRWLLVPSRENYARLPEMMRPTPVQRIVPHIGAIEICVLPLVRDATIQRLRDFLTPLTQSSCSVNWPYSMSDALKQNLETGSTSLTPQFIAHACQYDNWSVGTSFFKTFPELAGRIRVHD